MFSTPLFILVLVVLFALIVLVHELGHFLAARFFKVRVNEFAIGMGPKLFGVQRGETFYSVRLLPIGGFCSIEGEGGESDNEDSILSKKPWQKIIIFAAGAIMNFLLGWIIFTAVCGYAGYGTNQVDRIAEQTVVAQAGIEPGDTITSVDGTIIKNLDDLQSVITNKEQTYQFTFEKPNGKTVEVAIKPQQVKDQPMLGFYVKRTHHNIIQMIGDGFKMNIQTIQMIFDSVIQLFTGKVPVKDLAGIVGIAQISSDLWNEGMKVSLSNAIMTMVNFAGILSANLGVFNLLPLPALDGGRIIFALIEWVRGKPVPPEKEGMVHVIGFVLLMGLMIFTVFNDLARKGMF